MKKTILLPLLALCAFTACRKAPSYEDLSSELIVSTNLDKSANFSSYSTFYISDTIINLGGTGADTILFDSGAQQLVQTIRSNMIARGYTSVAMTANPDMVFTTSVVKNINVGVSYYPGWWDGYYGYWDPWYWGYYYPYYYPWTSVYTYSTGTIIINLVDLKNAAQAQRLNVIWNATSFGALEGSTSGNLTQATDAINQSFVQSPYLKK